MQSLTMDTVSCRHTVLTVYY